MHIKSQKLTMGGAYSSPVLTEMRFSSAEGFAASQWSDNGKLVDDIYDLGEF